MPLVAFRLFCLLCYADFSPILQTRELRLRNVNSASSVGLAPRLSSSHSACSCGLSH